MLVCSEGMAKTKANAQCNGGSFGDFSASASRVGPEGNCNRKGAIATLVRSEARNKQRMLRFEEASVGTEVNNHTDDLNIWFAHLIRSFPDVISKSRKKIDHGQFASKFK